MLAALVGAALDGWLTGVRWLDLSEKVKLKLELRLVAVHGVDTAGDSAFRKSVYALGGVMGVFMSSSTLRKVPHVLGCGLRGSSEGRTRPADMGVLSTGRLRLIDIAGEGMMVGEARAMLLKKT